MGPCLSKKSTESSHEIPPSKQQNRQEVNKLEAKRNSINSKQEKEEKNSQFASAENEYTCNRAVVSCERDVVSPLQNHILDNSILLEPDKNIDDNLVDSMLVLQSPIRGPFAEPSGLPSSMSTSILFNTACAAKEVESKNVQQHYLFENAIEQHGKEEGKIVFIRNHENISNSGEIIEGIRDSAKTEQEKEGYSVEVLRRRSISDDLKDFAGSIEGISQNDNAESDKLNSERITDGLSSINDKEKEKSDHSQSVENGEDEGAVEENISKCIRSIEYSTPRRDYDLDTDDSPSLSRAASIIRITRDKLPDSDDEYPIDGDRFSVELDEEDLLALSLNDDVIDRKPEDYDDVYEYNGVNSRSVVFVNEVEDKAKGIEESHAEILDLTNSSEKSQMDNIGLLNPQIINMNDASITVSPISVPISVLDEPEFAELEPRKSADFDRSNFNDITPNIKGTEERNILVDAESSLLDIHMEEENTGVIEEEVILPETNDFAFAAVEDKLALDGSSLLESTQIEIHPAKAQLDFSVKHDDGDGDIKVCNLLDFGVDDLVEVISNQHFEESLLLTNQLTQEFTPSFDKLTNLSTVHFGELHDPNHSKPGSETCETRVSETHITSGPFLDELPNVETFDSSSNAIFLESALLEILPPIDSIAPAPMVHVASEELLVASKLPDLCIEEVDAVQPSIEHMNQTANTESLSPVKVTVDYGDRSDVVKFDIQAIRRSSLKHNDTQNEMHEQEKLKHFQRLGRSAVVGDSSEHLLGSSLLSRNRTGGRGRGGRGGRGLITSPNDDLDLGV